MTKIDNIYNTPRIEIISFSEDIITTSGDETPLDPYLITYGDETDINLK